MTLIEQGSKARFAITERRVGAEVVTVCVVTHDRPLLLQRLLAKLAECETSGTHPRIIVVENGASQGGEAVARQADRRLYVDYFRCPSPLKCSALNMALRHIERGLVAFIDDDATPTRQWLAAYSHAKTAYGAGHYFGGPTLADYDQPPPDWLRRFLPDSAIGFDADNVAQEQHPHLSFLGFNWAADVDDLKACGGFSDEFGPGTDLGGGDETFMQYQLQEAGIKAVYVPDALVSHHVPVSRCSPRWGLQRMYFGGICHGIKYEHYQRTRRLPVRRVRAVARFLRRQSRRSDLARLVMLHPAGRHWLRHCFALGTGFWAGMNRGARDTPLDLERWRSRGLEASSLDEH